MTTKLARLLWISLLVAACSGNTPAAIVTQAPLVTPEPPLPTSAPVVGSGKITFGNRYDKDTLKVNPSRTTFKVGDRKIAWSAEFTEPAGALTVTWIIASKRASGTERPVWREKVDFSSPEHDTIAGAADLSALANRKPGTYVMRYLRGGTVLAEGEFRLVR